MAVEKQKRTWYNGGGDKKHKTIAAVQSLLTYKFENISDAHGSRLTRSSSHISEQMLRQKTRETIKQLLFINAAVGLTLAGN